MKQGPNKGQILFAKHLRELGLVFLEQLKFHSKRKWRFDFVLISSNIAIEIDGMYAGRHQGWGKDYEKQNVATMMGYRLLRFTTQEVERGKAKQFLAEWLGGSK